VTILFEFDYPSFVEKRFVKRFSRAVNEILP